MYKTRLIIAAIAASIGTGCASLEKFEPAPPPPEPHFPKQETFVHTSEFAQTELSTFETDQGYRYAIWYPDGRDAQPDSTRIAPHLHMEEQAQEKPTADEYLAAARMAAQSNDGVGADVWERFCNGSMLNDAEWEYVDSREIPAPFADDCMPVK